jgi:hypothetical protein
VRKRITEAEIAAIADYASQKVPLTEIARRIGRGVVTVARVYNHLQRVGHMGSYRVTNDLPPANTLRRTKGGPKNTPSRGTSIPWLCLHAFNGCETILSTPAICKVVAQTRPGYQPGAVNTALYAMNKKGLIKRVICGYYRLTPAGARAKNNLTGQADVTLLASGK